MESWNSLSWEGPSRTCSSMGRDVTCEISLLRATSKLALAKVKWLNHGVTKTENFTLTCNSESLGRRWHPFLSRTPCFLRKKHLQQTQQHEQLSRHTQDKGRKGKWENSAPAKSVQPECRELLGQWGCTGDPGDSLGVWQSEEPLWVRNSNPPETQGCLKLHLLN